MSNQPAPNQGGHSPIAISFPRDEWELLVTLPRRVLVAAVSAEAEVHRRTVAEGIAGIEAIASGRGSRSPLVREVVWAIYAEQGDNSPSVDEITDRDELVSQILAACARVTQVLRARVDAADSDAYRAWLRHIAAAVCGAGTPDGARGAGGTRVSLAENRFLGQLDEALT